MLEQQKELHEEERYFRAGFDLIELYDEAVRDAGNLSQSWEGQRPFHIEVNITKGQLSTIFEVSKQSTFRVDVVIFKDEEQKQKYLKQNNYENSKR